MQNNKLSVKDSSLGFLVGFLICQLAVTTITISTLFFCKLFKIEIGNISTFFNTAIGYIVLTLTLYIAMFFTFIFFNRKKENTLNKDFRFYKLILYILISATIFFCLYPIIVCVDSLLIKAGAKINLLPYTLNKRNYLLSLLSLVIAPAVCEELLFRGIIFQGLKKHGKALSIALSSLMFSIYHMSISQSIYPLLIGMFLGVIMFYEQNIYYCIAAHMTNNFLSLTLSYLKINLVFKHWSYIILALILVCVFLSVILTLMIKNNKSSKEQKISSNEKKYLLISFMIMLLFWIISNFS